MSDAAAALPFDISDRYAVTAEIGRGGFAVVYRARDRMLERDVAIKILRADSLPESALRRFSLELQVTARLEHPNILHVYDTGTWEGRPYYVMEYVRGQTLEARLSKEGVLALDDALGIASNVGDALAFAHSNGVVHRDVKPANILLGPGGALLGDFGIAHVLGENTLPAITSTGFAVGTMQYMSPEQLCAEPRIDARSDQYSLALVCYEMLTGVQPFVASTVEALRALRMVGSFAPASTHRPAVAAHVDAALARALAPAPADRFRDVREFAQALAGAGTAERTALMGGYSAGAPLAARVGSGGRAAGRGRAQQRLRIGTGIGALALLGLVGLGSASYFARRDPPAPITDAAMPAVGILSPMSGADSVFASQVHDELNEWRDVSVLPPVGSDRRSLDAMGVEGSRVLAAKVHATLLVDPVTSAAGDSSRFTLAVYDSRSGRLEHISRWQPRGQALDKERLRAVILRVLAGAGADSAHGIEQLHEPVIGAARAYVNGWRLMRAGAFDSAMAAFALSATKAPSFAEADLWTAQLGAWRSPREPSSFAFAAKRALSLSSALLVTDSLLAEGLVAMAAGSFPRACTLYRQAIARESDSFTAWYGLAQCQDYDAAVRRDQRVATGWSFRSSHWSALSAYEEALSHLPTSAMASLMSRIVPLTYASGNLTRGGTALPPDTGRFIAIASLEGDSIATAPEPKLQATSQGHVPTSFSRALTRARARLLTLTEKLVDKAPSSSDAWFSRGYSLELVGSYEGSNDRASAIRSYDRAHSLATDPELKARIAVSRVRIAMRMKRFAEAAKLAHIALLTTDTPSPAVALLRMPLAGFALDVGATERLLRIAIAATDLRTRRSLPAWSVTSLPPWLSDSVRAFGVRALLGACSELPARKAKLESDFEDHVAKAELAAQRESALHEIYRAAIPCLGPSAVRDFLPQSVVDKAVAALDIGDTAGARALLRGLAKTRQGMSSSTVTEDALLAETWATLQIGDTVVAAKRLRASMDDLSSLSAFTFDELAQAAALARVMRLTGQLP